MSAFSYRAKTAGGDLVSGTLDSEDSAAAARELKESGYFPIEIREVRARQVASPGSGPAIKRDVLTDFFSQLRDLIGAGIPLARALELLGENLKDPAMADLSRALFNGVAGGASLSDAMKAHPRAFKPLIRGIIAAGEGGGGLENVLSEIVRFLEEEKELADRARGLMAYPLIMALIGSCTIIFFLTFVIPKFAGIFEEMGETLPLLTRILLGVGVFISDYGWIIAVAAAAIFLLAKTIISTPEGKAAMHRALLSVPVAGRITVEINTGRFARALGLMLKNGVPLLRALDLATAAVGNSHIAGRLASLTDIARDGGTLHGALRGSGVIDPLVVDLVRVGEETGKLPDVLLKVGERYEKKSYSSLRLAVSLLEPAIIVAMGIAVAIVVLGMMLPILQINLAV